MVEAGREGGAVGVGLGPVPGLGLTVGPEVGQTDRAAARRVRRSRRRLAITTSDRTCPAPAGDRSRAQLGEQLRGGGGDRRPAARRVLGHEVPAPELAHHGAGLLAHEQGAQVVPRRQTRHAPRTRKRRWCRRPRHTAPAPPRRRPGTGPNPDARLGMPVMATTARRRTSHPDGVDAGRVPPRPASPHGVVPHAGGQVGHHRHPGPGRRRGRRCSRRTRGCPERRWSSRRRDRPPPPAPRRAGARRSPRRPPRCPTPRARRGRPGRRPGRWRTAPAAPRGPPVVDRGQRHGHGVDGPVAQRQEHVVVHLGDHTGTRRARRGAADEPVGSGHCGRHRRRGLCRGSEGPFGQSRLPRARRAAFRRDVLLAPDLGGRPAPRGGLRRARSTSTSRSRSTRGRCCRSRTPSSTSPKTPSHPTSSTSR